MKDQQLNQRIERAFEHMTPTVSPAQLFAEAPKKGEVVFMKKTTSKRKILSAVSIAAMVLLTVGVGLGLWGYDNYAVSSTVSLDVNPSIELELNKGGKVLDANALNEDGKTVLGTMEEKLKGVHVEVAVNALLGSMVKNGYVSDLSNSILVSVNCRNSENGVALQEKLTQEIKSFFDGEGYDFDSALLLQTVKGNAELKALAEQHGISLGKAQLIKRIIAQNTTYTFEDLVDLDINELNLLKGVKLDGVKTEGDASDKGYVGNEAALAAALAHAGLAEEQIAHYEIELDYKKRVMVYEIEFEHDGYEYEYLVDALTGQVIKHEKEADDDKDAAPEVPTDLIDAEAAKKAAYAHAEVSTEEVTRVKCTKDREDGQIVYEITFVANGFKYEYEVAATDGSIIKYGRESATDTGNNDKEENGDKENGKKTKEEAFLIALAHAGLTGEQVKKYDCKTSSVKGVRVYEIEFSYDGYEYEYVIQVTNGQIVEFEREADDDADEKDSDKNTDKDTDKNPNRDPDKNTDKDPDKDPDKNDNVPVKIGCGQSQLLALSYAGLEKEQVTKLWSTLQKYEGKIIHEVTFIHEGTHYTYRIDAATGENLGFSSRTAEERG